MLREFELPMKIFQPKNTKKKTLQESISFLHTKFSPTIPSLAAKKARTCLMKYCSSGVKRNQSLISLAKSTSSHVHIDANAHL